jgi:YD repeat-containing protein
MAIFSLPRSLHSNSNAPAGMFLVKCLVQACILGNPIPAHAQVAPTEVNQKSTDEFGFERKTGRLSWNSGDLIKIGGQTGLGYSIDENNRGSRLNIPRLRSNSDYSNWLRTVSYYADSQTFFGGSSYKSEYPVGSSLSNTPDGFLFTDKQGVKIEFGKLQTKMTYPDGREIIYGNGVHKTNFGYALKFSGQSDETTTLIIQAINQSVDYCSENLSTICTGLTKQRMVKFSRLSPGTEAITDMEGGQTLIRGFNRVAKMYRQTTNFVPPDELVFYLEGVTLPGSRSEDLTVTYKSIDQRYETHDDIWIKSIKKNGITANYSINRTQLGSGSALSPSTTYSLAIRATVNGQKLWESFAVKPTSDFGRSRRVLAYVIDPLGRRTWFAYNAAVEVGTIGSPSGLTEKNDFDTRNNVIRSTMKPPAGNGGDLVTSYTYAADCARDTQATCNKPLTITDPKGNVTEFTYNSRGQVLTQTLPAPSTGSSRPQTRYTYTLRTAYIKDVNGAPTPAGPPISLLTKTSTCSSQITCLGERDEVITSYDYGPTSGLNNLNLRGVSITAANEFGNMITNRTCYQYNYFGEKISETRPAANLTSCP